MCSNIIIPNLPARPVGKVIVQNEPVIVTALNKLGIECIHPEKDNSLYDEVSLHADMLCCVINGHCCIVAPGQEKLKAELEKNSFEVLFSAPLKEKYPGDILLNVALSDKYAVGNFKYTDKLLLEKIQQKTLINVNQGYAKCSVCFINENAVITEDESIAEALAENNVDVLLISKGDIYLSEKHYGFFGGSTGKISKDKLAVTGSLSYHKDGKKIRAFAEKYGVEIIELTKGKIKDVGGIVAVSF